MKKTSRRALTLRPETIRLLGNVAVARIKGGVSGPINTGTCEHTACVECPQPG